ncbi:MAG TPA: hypothetical protein VIJ18_01210 [Microbacteriaceae bacterium]
MSAFRSEDAVAELHRVHVVAATVRRLRDGHRRIGEGAQSLDESAQMQVALKNDGRPVRLSVPITPEAKRRLTASATRFPTELFRVCTSATSPNSYRKRSTT